MTVIFSPPQRHSNKAATASMAASSSAISDKVHPLFQRFEHIEQGDDDEVCTLSYTTCLDVLAFSKSNIKAFLSLARSGTSLHLVRHQSNVYHELKLEYEVVHTFNDVPEEYVEARLFKSDDAAYVVIAFGSRSVALFSVAWVVGTPTEWSLEVTHAITETSDPLEAHELSGSYVGHVKKYGAFQNPLDSNAMYVYEVLANGTALCSLVNLVASTVTMDHFAIQAIGNHGFSGPEPVLIKAIHFLENGATIAVHGVHVSTNVSVLATAHVDSTTVGDEPALTWDTDNVQLISDMPDTAVSLPVGLGQTLALVSTTPGSRYVDVATVNLARVTVATGVADTDDTEVGSPRGFAAPARYTIDKWNMFGNGVDDVETAPWPGEEHRTTSARLREWEVPIVYAKHAQRKDYTYAYFAYRTSQNRLRTFKLMFITTSGSVTNYVPFVVWGSRDQAHGFTKALFDGSAGQVPPFCLCTSTNNESTEEVTLCIGNQPSDVTEFSYLLQGPIDMGHTCVPRLAKDRKYVRVSYVASMLSQLTTLNETEDPSFVTITSIGPQEGSGGATLEIRFRHLSYANLIFSGTKEVALEIIQDALRNIWCSANLQIALNVPNVELLSESPTTETTLAIPRGTASAPCVVEGTVVFKPATTTTVTASTKWDAVPIESIREGDLVMTHLATAEEVEHVYDTHVWTERHNVPFLVKKGAFGRTLPFKDLLISRDHEMLIQGVRVQPQDVVSELERPRSTLKVYDNKVPTTCSELLGETVHYYHLKLKNPAMYFIANGLPVCSMP
jgi:hypothetical protein